MVLDISAPGPSLSATETSAELPSIAIVASFPLVSVKTLITPALVCGSLFASRSGHPRLISASAKSMEAKPLTKEALALTEKKMDMALDDIIKMSKNKPAKGGKRPRVPNKRQGAFNNAPQDKSMRVQRFMNSRSSLRQGVLAQKRSNFQGNQFPLANEAARRAAVAPFRSRAPPRDRMLNSNKARARAPLAKNRASNNASVTSKQHQDEGNGGPKQRPQTLDARFANLKEQRMKTTFPKPDNSMNRHNGGGGGNRKQIPPWTRFPK